ncbi:unnamed protein product, partial [Nesidiocoris tenuis]
YWRTVEIGDPPPPPSLPPSQPLLSPLPSSPLPPSPPPPSPPPPLLRTQVIQYGKL